MGTVTISLLAITRIDDLTNEAERINIEISLSRMLFNTSDYEAAIATGKHYDLFSSEQINTTTDSSISAYYSLYVEDASNFYRTGYHRALVSDYVLPENTKITMIDYHDHNNPEYYYNRELSWIKFDKRVLSEALDPEIPLFERLKFLSITASNLDEFFMIRVASLKDMVNAGYSKTDIAGMTPRQQLEQIDVATHKMVVEQYDTYKGLNEELKNNLIRNKKWLFLKQKL